MAIYMWREPTEIIIYKFKAFNWKIIIPIWWLNHSWWYWSYNWKVSIDWWQETTYSGTWSSWGSIQLSWYNTWQEYEVTISPVTEWYWWALCFWWMNVTYSSMLTEIVYDGSYMWYWESATSTWNRFRQNQYRWCTWLIKIPDEVLPVTVTSVWDNFRTWQYYWCTSLTTPANEVFPNTITSIWNYFRQSQYSWCTSLTVPANELLSTVTTIWSSFRYATYYGCTNLTYAAEEVLPNSVTTIWDYFRWEQYQNCTALSEIKWWKDKNIGASYYRQDQFNWCTTNKTVKVLSDVWYRAYSNNTLPNSYVTTVSVPSTYLSNFINASNPPRSVITDSKFVWY